MRERYADLPRILDNAGGRGRSIEEDMDYATGGRPLSAPILQNAMAAATINAILATAKGFMNEAVA